MDFIQQEESLRPDGEGGAAQEHELSRKLEAALERLNHELPVGLRILYRALDLRTAYTRAQKVPLSEQLGKLTKSVALRTGIFHSLCTSQPPESPILLSTYFLLEVWLST